MKKARNRLHPAHTRNICQEIQNGQFHILHQRRNIAMDFAIIFYLHTNGKRMKISRMFFFISVDFNYL